MERPNPNEAAVPQARPADVSYAPDQTAGSDTPAGGDEPDLEDQRKPGLGPTEIRDAVSAEDSNERRRKRSEPMKVVQEESGRSVPIRCHIEPAATEQQTPQSLVEGSEGHIDTYAIVPSATPFCEVVRVALLKLGYTMSEAVGAKGWIQIKNWLPLSLDQISPGKDCSVEDMLGDVSSVVTLKIKLCSRSRAVATTNGALDVRDKLLHLLLAHSRALLQTSGCPVEKELQTIVANGESIMDADKYRQFEHWYKLQLDRLKPSDEEPRDFSSDQRACDEPREVSSSPPPGARPPEHDSRSSSPKLPLTYPRPRFRTSFDPDLEIPRLQQWFHESTHPSRDKMLHYLQVLNSLGTRKNRKPLDLTNIIYWFKNARAAQRRASRTTELEEESADDIPQLPNKNAVYMFSPHNNNKEIMDSSSALVAPTPTGIPGDVTADADLTTSATSTTTTTTTTSPLATAGLTMKSSPPSSDFVFKSESLKTEDEALDMTKKAASEMDDSDSNSGDDMRDMEYAYRPDILPHQMPQLHLVPMHYRLNTLMQAHNNLQQHHFYSSVMHQRPLMDERRKRTRVFIDPLSEIPKLEAWFLQDSHPTSYMIEKYAEELNQSEYRQRFPKLEPKNIQLWFKNHRAKVKRARMEAENKSWDERTFHNGC